MEVDCRTASHLFVGGNLASRCLPRDLFSLSPLGWSRGRKKLCARCRVILNFLPCHSSVPALLCTASWMCPFIFFFSPSQCTPHVFLSLLDMRRGPKRRARFRLTQQLFAAAFFLNRPSAFRYVFRLPHYYYSARRTLELVRTRWDARPTCLYTEKENWKRKKKTRHRTLNNAHSKVLCCIFLSFSSYFYVSS